MIRVVVADDHPVVRKALAQLLDGADGIAVVATASNGAEAVAAALEHSPDVVLMDLEMPGQNGIDATHALTTAGSGATVVILTTFSDRKRILAAMDAGAVGYLLKDAEHEEIIRGVQAAAAGDAPLAPRAAREMLEERARPQTELALSARELEVLRLVARGLPNKLIARELEISEKTVKAHLTSVFSQLGVTDRTQAALWAQRHLHPY
ncbi:MAG TPA: response regulator transcription factor [Solirubrobacteraceae bacterium]|nr:response regulator transcription factor [Solirubrobacteraceae bacterium]